MSADRPEYKDITDHNGKLTGVQMTNADQMPLAEAMPVVTEIFVDAKYVICPHCQEEVDGWLGDPRGAETECDSCKKPFKVNDDADLEIR